MTTSRRHPLGIPRCLSPTSLVLDYLGSGASSRASTDEVDPRFEIAACIRGPPTSAGPALLFEHVRGSDQRVAGGVFCSPDKASLALETDDHADAVQRFADGDRGTRRARASWMADRARRSS